MTQTLIWNFKFATQNPFSLSALRMQEKDSIKWEARVFWPKDVEIILNNIDPNLLHLNHYKHKLKEDSYYLLANAPYNIKRRGIRLLYKPLAQKLTIATGFDPKIDLDAMDQYPKSMDSHALQKIRELAKESAKIIPIKKESYVYTFLTTPKIKLELARLEIFEKIYFSTCIEGRSLYLVETICEHLMGRQTYSDYVSFLKKISS